MYTPENPCIIMIVDDSPEDRATFRRYLERAPSSHPPYQIIEADSGGEALELYFRYCPHLVLMDFSLPDIDGIELVDSFNRFKASQAHETKFIMLTGQGNMAIAQEAMEHNIHSYLSKDKITKDLFLSTIQEILLTFLRQTKAESEKIINLLVIDSSQENQENYRRFLSRTLEWHFNFTFAVSGHDAVEICRWFNPDMILLDINLPDMGGITLLVALKEIIDLVNIPVVMVIEQEGEEVIVRAMKDGVKAYFLKDQITPIQLRKTMIETYGKNRLEAELRKHQAQQDLVAKITFNIRKSLDLTTILETTVEQVRSFFQSDRVLIYKFDPDYGGMVIAESLGQDVSPLLHQKITDTFFQTVDTTVYLNAQQLQIINDMSTYPMAECHRMMLTNYGVKSSMVLALGHAEVNQGLWGLLIVHYCHRCHYWQNTEITFLKQLASQLTMAISQGY
ncbi:MAG: response regulator [Synechococcaceae cyanobacterium RL_1_2]|nr:response regulator [Synechococcaceae cyanobacterium RL_1_2]